MAERKMTDSILKECDEEDEPKEQIVEDVSEVVVSSRAQQKCEQSVKEVIGGRLDQLPQFVNSFIEYVMDEFPLHLSKRG